MREPLLFEPVEKPKDRSLVDGLLNSITESSIDKEAFMSSNTAQMLAQPDAEGNTHDVGHLYDNDLPPALQYADASDKKIMTDAVGAPEVKAPEVKAPKKDMSAAANDQVEPKSDAQNVLDTGDLWSWPKKNDPKPAVDNSTLTWDKQSTSEHTLVYGGENGREKGSPAEAHLIFSRILYEYSNRANMTPSEMEGGDISQVRAQRLDFEKQRALQSKNQTDDKVALWGHQTAGQLTHGFASTILNVASFDQKPPDVQFAILNLLNLRQNKNGDIDWDGVARATVFDPFNLVGLTSLKFFSAPFTGAKAYTGKKIIDGMINTVRRGKLMAVMGAEGNIYASSFEMMQQYRKIEVGEQEEYDWEKIGLAGAIGTGLGGALSLAPGAVKAFNKAAVNMAASPGTLRMGVGPADTPPPIAEPFYSAVSQAVDTLPQDKGSGDQMRAMIAKAEGVKPDEMAWIGLDDFLKGKKNVTKQEIKEYVDANQVRIEEVVKSDDPINMFKIAKQEVADEIDLIVSNDEGLYQNYDIIEPLIEKLVNTARHEDYDDVAMELGDALINAGMPTSEAKKLVFDNFEIAEEAVVRNNRGKDTKFSGPQTTLPGGENYREVLLRLPQNKRMQDAANRQRKITANLKDENGRSIPKEQWSDEVRKEYDGLGEQIAASKPFTRGHFEENDVLAHVRLNDRTGPNGEKILFVEEIQSDWHQKARGIRKIEIEELAKRENITEEEAAKRVSETIGYADPERMAELKARRAEILKKRDAAIKGADWSRRLEELTDKRVADSLDGLTNAEKDEYISLVTKREAFDKETAMALKAVDSEIASRAGAVPDAPLKKNWHEMSFRRIARMAAEEGYDSISWTPGKIQAERYNLSDQVSELRAEKHDDGTYSFGYIPPEGGHRRQLKTSVPESELNELIGKEMAEKVRGQNQEMVDYSGLDLEVGGKGMKGFYDKMVKKYAEKWGKKFGAKVETTNIETGIKTDVSGIDIIENNGRWTVIDRPNGGEQLADFSNKSDAETYIVSLEIVAQGEAKPKVWSMKITQKMRDSLMKKGVPLFGAAGAAATIGMQGEGEQPGTM